MYKEQDKRALDTLSTVSSFYTSTNNAVIRMTNRVKELDILIAGNNTMIFANSSILNNQLINLAIFDTQIKNNINIQERASYEYRETYCRLKRIDLQNSYESQVLNAIQIASTTSGQLQASNPSIAITPTPANLNTPPITSAYNSLVSINTFLSNFTTIYGAYDMQMSNIQKLSTSIGAQSNAWSTLSFYDSDNFYNVPMPTISLNMLGGANDEVSGEEVVGGQQQIGGLSIILPTKSFDNTRRVMADKAAAANFDFSQKQEIVATALQTYVAGNKTIASAKQQFSTTYTTFFNGSEILTQESTISSFMISGYNQAIANLAAQGIIFTL